MRNRPKILLSDDKVRYVRSLVIHDADGLLAFNKPSGLAVQTRGNRGLSLDHLLWAFARSNGKRPRLVHRLDAGTSGLILAAHTKPATVFLSEQFAHRHVEKTYYALVAGNLPDKANGVCDLPLLKTGRISRPGAVAEGAQAAETAWKIIQRTGDIALMQAKPKTGRMHQIRVHFAALGCPIIGDPVYGSATDKAQRLMLHAAALSFQAPDKTPLKLEVPLPDEFHST